MTGHSWMPPSRAATDSQLQALVVVHETLSFTRAAKALGVTQSAVSRAITALEESLGAELLSRNASGVQFTDLGNRTVVHAREILRLKATIQYESRAVRRGQSGVVQVGSFGTTSSSRLLPPLQQAIASRYPDLRIDVIEGTDDEVVTWIRSGKVDVGFVTLPNDEFDIVPIAQDEMLVVVPADSPLAAQRSIRAEHLREYPFIMPTGGCEPEILSLLAANEVDVRFRIREIQTIVDLVAQGAGFSIKPALSLPDPLPQGAVARPLEPPHTRVVALACVDRARLSPAVRKFLDEAEAQRDPKVA